MHELERFITNLDPSMRRALAVQLQAELDGGWIELYDDAGVFDKKATKAFNALNRTLLKALREVGQ